MKTRKAYRKEIEKNILFLKNQEKFAENLIYK